jgi:hypothetical protein
MNADAHGEGYRILRSDSTLLPLELLWRWSFGLGLLALLFFAYAHLRQAVLLSDADQSAFSGEDPLAIATAVAGLIAGAQPLLLRTFTQVAAVASVLWVAAAALGRGLLTRIIVRRFAVDYNLKISPDAPRWRSFAILKIARVLMLLILVIGYLAGVLIAALVNPPGQNVLTDSLIIFAAIAASSVLWSYVNWVLSLAPIFVARDGLSALDSLVAALAFLRRNGSRLMAIAIWNSTLRGLSATVITAAAAVTVSMRAALPGWAITALVALETLLYLVISDFFLLVRFAAYSSVAVRELTLSQALPEAPEHSGTPAP